MTTSIGLKTKRLMADKIRANRRKLAEWQLERSRQAPPPFYCSVDLRDSGHKIVPVDSNLFPAGFNNICPEDLRAAGPTMRAHVAAEASRLGVAMPTRILVMPESHTSNLFYIENLFYLLQILDNAGFETRLGWYGAIPEGMTAPLQLRSQTDKLLEAYPLEIGQEGPNAGSASAGGFVPDMVVLNNDFSSGYPEVLDKVRQPVMPSHRLGWHSRRKSTHFTHYNRLAGEFAEIAGIDPWLIQIDTEGVAPVDFNEDVGIEETAAAVDRVLERTRVSYEKYGIKRKPFAFVKNDHGTYGMGIMVVHSGDELRAMNRRTKNKMSVGKNRAAIDSVAVQEGIPTTTLVDRLAAEPVIYLFGGQLIGGFLRTNTEKGDEENLNSQGMVFRKLCMSDLREKVAEDGCIEPEPVSAEDVADGEAADPNAEQVLMELVYGSVARISAMASGFEMAELNKR